MKGCFALLVTIMLPAMGFAGGDSGWAERGNGNESLPPECYQGGVVDPRQPIRPVTDSDIIHSSQDPVDTTCTTNENIIGPTQPKINN